MTAINKKKLCSVHSTQYVIKYKDTTMTDSLGPGYGHHALHLETAVQQHSKGWSLAIF